MEDNIFETFPVVSYLMDVSGRDIQSATLKLMEELGEFTSAHFGLSSYKKNTPEDLQEEVVDVLQCAMGLYHLVQKQYPFNGEQIMKEKLEKWATKYDREGSIEANDIILAKEDKEDLFKALDKALAESDMETVDYLLSPDHLETITLGENDQEDEAYKPLIKLIRKEYLKHQEALKGWK